MIRNKQYLAWHFSAAVTVFGLMLYLETLYSGYEYGGNLSSYGIGSNQHALAPSFHDSNPWKDVPDFVMYLRFTSSPRFVKEYRNYLLRTMKVFFPPERVNLLVVLDNEKPKDHQLGERLKREWPYPRICYRDPGDRAIYQNWGKGRMYWDMMYSDSCTIATYVGFIDSDTFFTTFVTPDLLFEDGKAIIIAKIGPPPYACWTALTEIFLGKKEVLQCMSTFPVMIKTAHLKEMRMMLAREKGKSFDDIFKESSVKGGHVSCMCQFSIMCNYVWYNHRDDYSWHLQMVPDGNWKGEHSVPSMPPIEYYNTVIKPEMKIPIPRVSIHLRYTISNNGTRLNGWQPSEEKIENIRAGLCYSGGFRLCPGKCKKWNINKVHYFIYSFEFYEWIWDVRCFEEQQKHFKKVETFLQYYSDNNLEIFGLKSIDDMCTLI